MWYIAVKPRNVKENLVVRSRITEVLGRKYRFAGDDERAISYWDQIENEEQMRKIFKGIQIFMAVVGGMTLFIAGVGIANIMYVVVKERTREIGIKRAIGAKRRHIVAAFVMESFLVTGIGGLLGTLGALTLIAIVSALPLAESQATEMLGTPTFSPAIAFFTIVVLISIGLFAGIYPARRASRIEPVEALRYE